VDCCGRDFPEGGHASIATLKAGWVDRPEGRAREWLRAQVSEDGSVEIRESCGLADAVSRKPKRGERTQRLRSDDAGSPTNAMVPEQQIIDLALKGWRFSGHTHPGITRTVLWASNPDRLTLQLFREVSGQHRSVILNSAGQYQKFTPNIYDDIFFEAAK